MNNVEVGKELGHSLTRQHVPYHSGAHALAAIGATKVLPSVSMQACYTLLLGPAGTSKPVGPTQG